MEAASIRAYEDVQPLVKGLAAVAHAAAAQPVPVEPSFHEGTFPAPVETGPGAFPKIPLMGLDFAVVTEEQTVQHVIGELADGRGGWICTVNIDILRQWRRSADVREMISRADLLVADGMPLVWASMLQGTPLPERVAGSTLTLTLSEAASKAGASVFLVGGNPGTAVTAAERLRENNPDLEILGTLCPPFGFEHDPEYLAELEREVVAARPDIVFVGLSFPKGEGVIERLRERLPGTWFIGCGVTFSFIAGEVVRAPVVFQRVGLEWLHRMIQEPRRLWRRYLLDGLPFAIELMSAALLGRRQRAQLQLEPPRP
jgi:N-acetylglucosaminyldiphosphoundecaprenol N-acetyl-beta-D-mannosaminyltransferase